MSPRAQPLRVVAAQRRAARSDRGAATKGRVAVDDEPCHGSSAVMVYGMEVEDG